MLGFPPRIAGGTAPEGCHDASGGTFGGQVGYRWQAGTWVFGVEAQGNWADFKGSNISLIAPAIRNESRVDAFGLFTGQIGYAANNVLFYAKGGAAVTSDRFRTFVNATNVQNSSTSDDTRWGGVVGVGLEYGFAPNWSAAIEYDHLFMQDRTYSFTAPAGAFVGTDRIRQDVDLVTVRVNYKFGGPIDRQVLSEPIVLISLLTRDHRSPGHVPGLFCWDAGRTLARSQKIADVRLALP